LRVSLFVTCLVDQCWPRVGVSTARLLRRLGHDVRFDGRQTCCGQPAFNTGYRAHARALARRFVALFEDAEAIVAPSGSCVAMVRHFPELLEYEPAWCERARSLGERVHELSSFLVDVLGVEDVGARFDGRVTWHDACHGRRDLGVREQPRRLLQHVAGASLVEAESCEACCGFGGTFSVKYPEISVAIADRKLEEIERLGVDAVVSADVSCLLHLDGRLRRRGARAKALHLAEVLA
jgi:L-lactate dehydrogenase complex protein LldE